MGATYWWLFFSMSAGISMLGSLLLLTSQKVRSVAAFSLSMLLFLFSLTLIQYVLVWSGNISNIPHLSGLWQISNYLYGPLLLLFYLDVRKTNWKLYIINYIPAFILFLAWLPFGISSTESKLAWVQEKHIFDSGLLIHRLFLHLLSPSVMVSTLLVYVLFYLMKARKMKGIEKRSKKRLAILFLVFVLAQLTYFVLVRSPYFTISSDYIISLAMTGCIFSITWMIIHQPTLFFILKKPKPSTKKYTTSPLTSNQSAKLAMKIKSFVENNDSYLDARLRLPKLAKQMGLNTHQISQAINETFQCSFSEWINHYRIEHACRLLQSNSYSAKEVGFLSGFNSISSFYQIFKKAKGISPAKYVNNKNTSSTDI